MPKTALAALVGVSTATVKRWETGQSCPSVFEIHQVAIVTQSDPVELLGTRAEYELELGLRQTDPDAELVERDLPAPLDA